MTRPDRRSLERAAPLGCLQPARVSDQEGNVDMRLFTSAPQRALTASCLAAVALLAAACSSSGTATPTTTVTVTLTPSASPAPTSSAPSGPGQCATTDLKLTVGASQGAAGTMYYPLDFTNESSSACTMYGYPGVSFVTGAHGSQIGPPAAREGGIALALITLAPGAVANATLAVSNVLASTNCKNPVTVNWLKVYPPDQYSALVVPLRRQGCADKSLVIMHVRPVSSGA